MKLCIAEKPSVAKEIATILKANSRKDGYFEGNGYYVSWTFGHLCTLKAPDDYSKEWKRWDLSNLPMIPQRFGIKLIPNKGVEKQFKTIERLVKQSQEVINCGDAGIEGELIQRWVLIKAKSKLPLKRLWISSLTEEALKEGFQNLKNGEDYDPLFAAGNARAIGDWLLGMNASRLFTVKYGKGRAVLSVGRVQTPTLALIVQRFKEVESFKPEPFWEIKTLFKNVIFNSTKGKFKSVEEAQVVIDSIKTEEFEIVSFTKKDGKEHAPKLFDLTALQVECNKKHDFSADETLQYIQALYEKKMVTYPRVDTTFLPTDMFPKIEGILKRMDPYAQFTQKVLAKKIKKNKRVFDDAKITDHHAIIPTGVAPTNLTIEQKRVYDTIARRFIAAFYPDCLVSNTTVLGDCAGYEFKATGKVILDQGWRELYPAPANSAAKSSAEGGDQEMPLFEKGEKGPHEPDLLQKETSPPKMYTEATLLRAMETAGKQVDDEELSQAMKENGIGRPSTRANIIETLFKRSYVVRQRKNLVPTQTGIGLIDTIQNPLLKSVELTGMWENKLRKIERGEYDPNSFMDEMKSMVTELVFEVKSEQGRTIAIEEKETPKKKAPKKSTAKELLCAKCGAPLLKGKNAYGCSKYKEGCKFVVSFVQYDKKLTDKQIQTLLQKKKTATIKGFVVNGEKVDGILTINDQAQIQLEQAKTKAPKELSCPICNKGKMLQGKAAYGCSRYSEGCKFVIPFSKLKSEHNGKKLTQALLKQIADEK